MTQKPVSIPETVPAVGNPAPDFRLTADDGSSVRLSGLRGQRVVLYSSPKDDTPGCTTQACGFRDHYLTISEQNAVVLGITPDGKKSHAKFRTKFDLPFRLLADTETGWPAFTASGVRKACTARTTWASSARIFWWRRAGSRMCSTRQPRGQCGECARDVAAEVGKHLPRRKPKGRGASACRMRRSPAFCAWMTDDAASAVAECLIGVMLRPLCRPRRHVCGKKRLGLSC